MHVQQSRAEVCVAPCCSSHSGVISSTSWQWLGSSVMSLRSTSRTMWTSGACVTESMCLGFWHMAPHSLCCELQAFMHISNCRFSWQVVCLLKLYSRARGRAYPMHPHLNHLGADICRGLLSFAQAKPLGDVGLYWLKVSVGGPALGFRFVDCAVTGAVATHRRPFATCSLSHGCVKRHEVCIAWQLSRETLCAVLGGKPVWQRRGQAADG